MTITTDERKRIERLAEKGRRSTEQIVEHLESEDERVSEASKKALSALLGDSEGEPTYVPLNNQVEIPVKTHISGKVEDMLGDFRRKHKAGEYEEDPRRFRRACANLCYEMVAEGSEYKSALVWREYGEQYGSAALMSAFTKLSGPATKRIEEDAEAVDTFRDE